MKKLLAFAPLLLILVVPTLAHAASNFVGLTEIPNLTKNVNTDNLTAFFNQIYLFCIGAAAVLAVLEITIGGFQVMSGDSVTAHSDGRDRIMGAIIGLILVLSPVVVFSIINPCILTFTTSGSCKNGLNSDLQKLQPNTTTSAKDAASKENAGFAGKDTGSNPESGGTSPGISNGTQTATGDSDAPSGLQSSNQTDTSVSLSWKAPTSGATPAAYDIYKDGKLVQSVTSTSATVPLTKGSLNTFTVKARDAAGKSSPSSGAVAIDPNGIESVTVNGAHVPEGSLGSYAWSDWSYAGNFEIYNGDPVPAAHNCWRFHVTSYPNPSYANDKTKKIDVAAYCLQALQSAQSAKIPQGGKATHFYSCQKLQPNQQVTPNPAPGAVCQ